MDKKRSILNVSVSIFSRIILLAAAMLIRRLLIRHIGNDVNGLNSLFANIISMLSVAELGIGTAIIYSMYKPIIEGNDLQTAALYHLYNRIYRIIGAVIFGAGLLILPFLHLLINDFETLTVNVYAAYFLTLTAAALSYLYSAKTSLLEAYKNNYITTSIMTAAHLIRYGLQAAAILILKSYFAFLLCQILETVIIWILTEKTVRKKYGNILILHASLAPVIKSEIRRNVKAIFMHKIGTFLVNSMDNIFISGFIGVAALGKYSNYTLLASVISGTIVRFFSPLTSVVGHLCAKGDPERSERNFNHFYCLNFILGTVCFLGFYAVADSTVALLFGPGLQVSHTIVFIITLKQFTQYMRRTALLFHEASGIFYYDRWKPVVEGVVNLILSLIFINVFPEDFRIAGVIASTIITTLLICDIVEPYVVFHHVFQKSPRRFYVRSYAYKVLFLICLLIMTRIMQYSDNNIRGIIVNGLLSLAVSAGVIGLLAAADKSFRAEIRIWIKAAFSWLSKMGQQHRV